jgi:NADH-quinone oxidoreductase subunit M
MTLFAIPWLELALAAPTLGAVLAWVSRDPRAGWRIGFVFSGAAFLCTILAYIGHRTGAAPGGVTTFDLIHRLIGGRVFGVDDLNAPLLPFVALLHLLIVAGTTGGKAARLSFPSVLTLEAVHLATFAAIHVHLLVALLALGTLLPFLELAARGYPTRLYAMHMGLYVSLLGIGMAVGQREGFATPLAWIPLAIAVLIRCGIAPAHLWAGNLFSSATFGTAILMLTPMTGVLAAVRLLVPVCPEAVLEAVGVLSLVTALYAAGLAVVQIEARRFIACLCIGNTALVLAGVCLATELGVTAALSLWISAGITLTGASFALRAVESRIGEIALTEFHGLYDRAPALAVCFLFAGLGTVGFPGTLGFLPLEVLIERAVATSPALGVGIAITIALSGFAVLRAYALIFTGTRHTSAIPLGVTHRERFNVLVMALLVFGGGLLPQALFDSRQPAAQALLEHRTRHAPASPIHPQPLR